MESHNHFQDRADKCPLCNGRELSPLYKIDRFSPGFDVEICNQCGHIFMNPIWKDDYLQQFYEEDYFIGNSEFHYRDERDQIKFEKKVWQARLKNIRKYIPEGNFCDIGCSFGGFLEEAAKDYQPFGVEISKFASTEAKKVPNIVLHQGPMQDVPWLNNSLDIITAIEVIEHIPDPKVFIKKAGDLLRPGGLLILQTADFDGWQAIKGKHHYHYFLPGHLHYFSAPNLKQKVREWANIDKIIEFRGTDFGLLAKLQKSRGSFKSLLDYQRWCKTIFYHIKSKIRWKGRYLTSAMVLYCFKKNSI